MTEPEHLPARHFNVPTRLLHAKKLATLDVCQQRLLLSILGTVRARKAQNFEVRHVTLTIPVAELMEAYPGEKDRRRLWADLKVVASLSFEREEWDMDGLVLNVAEKVHFADILADFRGGLAKIRIPPEVVVLIQTPEHWAQISREALFSMRSKHAQRLYQLIRDWEGAGRRRERRKWLWLDDFKAAMHLELGTYEEFALLNRKVIKPAADEVNRLGMVEVEIIPHRRGRKVQELEIRWHPKVGQKAKAAADETRKTRGQRKAEATHGQQTAADAPPLLPVIERLPYGNRRSLAADVNRRLERAGELTYSEAELAGNKRQLAALAERLELDPGTY